MIEAKELQGIIDSYILGAISNEDDELFEDRTDKEKLEHLAKCFTKEFVFHQNILRHRTIENLYSEWIQGLPSSFNVDYYYHRIIEIGKAWELIPDHATEDEEDYFISEWYRLIAKNVIRLFFENGIVIKTKL